MLLTMKEKQRIEAIQAVMDEKISVWEGGCSRSKSGAGLEIVGSDGGSRDSSR